MARDEAIGEDPALPGSNQLDIAGAATDGVLFVSWSPD